MAVRTCEGSRAPDVQADPVLRATWGKFAMSASASTPSNRRDEFPGRRRAIDPFRLTLSTPDWTIFSNQSRNRPIRIDSLPISSLAISQAFPNPTIPGTLRVPDRRPHSWTPTNTKGANGADRAPPLTYSAPTPLGP